MVNLNDPEAVIYFSNVDDPADFSIQPAFNDIVEDLSGYLEASPIYGIRYWLNKPESEMPTDEPIIVEKS